MSTVTTAPCGCRVNADDAGNVAYCEVYEHWPAAEQARQDRIAAVRGTPDDRRLAYTPDTGRWQAVS